MKLAGRNAIITGANQGLGEAIALEFVRNGASIMLCARNKAKLAEVSGKLKALASKGQKVFFISADVSREKDVVRLISRSEKELGRIDILVNNAGIYGPKGAVENVDSRKWVETVEINLFGVFFCCKHIISHMKKNGYGKIVNLSGGGATAPLPFISAYAASKAAVVRFTETLACECAGYNIDVNSIAPGALNTRLLDEVLKAGPNTVGKEFYERAVKQKDDGGVPLELGASLCVFLASRESDGITGRLISAKWDSWNKLCARRKELADTDIFTLRRIVPQDRGIKWD